MAMKKAAPRTQWLVQQLQDDIRKRKLREGDFYATEAELCEQYGLSRSIVRESVSRLRAMDVLVSRQKKGLVVGRANPLGSLSKVLPLYGIASAENRLQLGELRYTLEIGAVEMASMHRSEEQARELADIAEQYAVAVAKSDVAQCIEHDMAFHNLLLRMTDNPLIAGMQGILLSYFNTFIKASEINLSILGASVWQHHAVAEALAARNTDLARAVLRNHLEPLLHAKASSTEETVRSLA